MSDLASDPLTHRRVLGIALPIVLSNATVPILGAVDTAVVGQMGSPVPIGAVGIGALILSMLYWVFGFLRMGTPQHTETDLGLDEVTERDRRRLGIQLQWILARCCVFRVITEQRPVSTVDRQLLMLVIALHVDTMCNTG